MSTPLQSSCLAETMGVSPESFASLILIGHSYYQQGKFAEARDVFEAMVLLDSTKA